jgi:aspartate/methionine/tyrosine aminotransferase
MFEQREVLLAQRFNRRELIAASATALISDPGLAQIIPDSTKKPTLDSTIVNLSTAENLLLLDFFQQTAFVGLGPITQATIRYPKTIYGNGNYLAGVREFLRHQWNVSVNYEDIFAVSGVSASLECLALSLFKAGDEVIIPAPMWHGFPWSFTQSAGMRLVPFHIDDGVNLTIVNVRTALQQHPDAKLLVLTNPNNPLGINYSRGLLEEIYSIVLENPDRHIISDEIYACSQVGDKNKFVSALNLDAYKKFHNRIHMTWGLSKDFGLAGFRIGFIISKSPIVQKALKGDTCKASLAWFSPFANLNQYMTEKFFLNSGGDPDPDLADTAMVIYERMLREQYIETARHLKKGNISFYSNNTAAIFFWIDLRSYLNLVPESFVDQPRLCADLYEHDDPREARLLNYIRDKAGVLLIRGQRCFNAEPGFFRLCYTADKLDRVTFGIDNMIKALEALPQAQ